MTDSYNQGSINLVAGAKNEGFGSDVFAEQVNGLLIFRRLRGINGTSVITNAKTIDIDGGGSSVPIQSVSFLDNTTIDIPVGTLAIDGSSSVDMSIFNTVTGVQQSIQWSFGISNAFVSADIVEIPSDENSPLPIIPTAEMSGANALARLSGLGGGDLTEVRFRTLAIPRL